MLFEVHVRHAFVALVEHDGSSFRLRFRLFGLLSRVSNPSDLFLGLVNHSLGSVGPFSILAKHELVFFLQHFNSRQGLIELLVHVIFASLHQVRIIHDFCCKMPRNVLALRYHLPALSRHGKCASSFPRHQSQNDIATFTGRVAFLAFIETCRTRLRHVDAIPADRAFLPSSSFLRRRAGIF
jgi:hypothetical protein